MVERMNSLPSKHEDLSSIPSTYVFKSLAAFTYNPSSGAVEIGGFPVFARQTAYLNR